MFPLKMTSWSITSISSPRLGLISVSWCGRLTNHQQKCLAEVYTWIYMRIWQSCSLWWKIVCSDTFVHIYFIDTSSIIVKQTRITESLCHKGPFQERILLFKNEAHDVCRICLLVSYFGHAATGWCVGVPHQLWMMTMEVNGMSSRLMENPRSFCTKWATKPVRSVGLWAPYKSSNNSSSPLIFKAI